jgi:hypothetical protein
LKIVLDLPTHCAILVSVELIKDIEMKVFELIELLKQMPQDVDVQLGLNESGSQTGEGLLVSLEKFKQEEYVFIGDY